ncbi:related to HXT5 - Hexose transporter with moderate affinity for glucose [Pseudozyma flocculosa]|uniref:Related to HXT5 - Hexose transporter with moderate affinity for glucose n=1 Tax=Pseudozyma flocculosa TaxID=84751 RepID=A0A5C3EVZ8_9BASI|nr:related to HXT5 - Hexose transporter with moderate affinity for glucose [Pseudozyma flocculosa]
MSDLDKKLSPSSEHKDTNEKILTEDAKTSQDHSSIQHVDGAASATHKPNLENPLWGVPRDRLLHDVEVFAREKGLEEHTELLKKGALVAQDPGMYKQLAELDQDEKDAITHEFTHRWSHPWTLYLTIFSCSIGAATQGWDQTGSNGANLSFPDEFGIATTGPDAEKHEWLVGAINAAPYIASALCGCWLSDPLNNFFGRRGCIFITALVLIATPIGSAFTTSWEQLFVVRLILGLGMGAKGFAANVVVADVGKIAWRLQLGSAFIPALPLACLIYLCPESPRWLMKKGRYQEAMKSLLRLRHHRIQAARDLYYIHVMLVEESKIIRGETYVKRFLELFTIPRVRRATIAASVVMLAQQMCGINIVAFYSSSIFVEGGYSAKQALYASLGFGAVNFVFAFPALFTIDTKTRIGLVAFFVYLFAAFYSPGEGPVPFTYSAEVFPLAQREQGMAWAVATCLFWAAVLSITFPRMLKVMTPTGAFGFYAGLNLVAFCLIFLFVPETKQLTLEELDIVFSVPTKDQVAHGFNEELPYFYRRWIKFDKSAKLRPLVDNAAVREKVLHDAVSPA